MGAVVGGFVAAAVDAVATAFAGAGAAIAAGLGIEGTVLGVSTAGLIGAGLEGATIGGLGGGLISAATGKPILPGIVEGGLTGLGAGAGGAVGGLAGSVIGGASGGALGNTAEGKSPLQGAESGAIAGLASGALGQAFGGSSTGDAGLSADPGLAVAPSFSEGLTPATGGTIGGPIDSGSFDIPGQVGITATSPGATAAALGGGAPLAIGPGAPALAPPTSTLATTLDPTSALAQSQGGGLFTGATTSENAASTDLPFAGQTGSAAEAQPALDQAVSEGLLPNGQPETPPFGGAIGADVKGAVSGAGALLNSPTGKLLSAGASGVGLLRSLTSAANPNPIPGEAQLQQLATQLGQTGANLVQTNAPAAEAVAGGALAQSQTLENYLTTGTLPAPVQDALNRATQSAITEVKARYASRGMPPGSSAEQQDIASLRQNAVVNGGSLAASLYSQGVSQEQLAAQIFGGLVGQGTSAASAGAGAQESVVGTNTAINNGVNSAIASLASSLGGGHAIVSGNTVQVV